jgi:AcrR family transcriptional regulator
LRSRLIDAAEKAMLESGPLGLRIDDVTERAGCSRATLYRHVADKDELVREVLVRQAATLAEQLEAEIDDAGDPADWIAEGLIRNVEAVREQWWFQALERQGATSAVARLGGGPEAVVQLALPLVARFLDRVAAHGVLRPDITVEEATEWLVVVHIGLLTQDIPGERSREERAAFIRRFVAYPLLRAPTR